MNSPLVSICIPTYNRSELLLRAIRSCQAQTYPHFEIIITDNSDNEISKEAVQKLAEARIRYFKNEKNLGPFENVNKAASLVTGKYVKFLMDDDLLKPKCLELMVAALEKNPTAGVAMAPMELIDPDDRRIFPKFYMFRKMTYRYRYQIGDGLVPRRKILQDFLTKDYPCCVPSGIMWRQECFKKLGLFDLNCDFAIDLDFCMRMAVYWDFYYIDHVLSSWRYFPVNHTATLHQKGLPIEVFYRITRKVLANKDAMKLFSSAEQPALVRDSIYFCSCRALLNAMAGIRARSSRLITETIKIIFREDPFLINKIRLPFFAAREIFVSIYPPELPPARE